MEETKRTKDIVEQELRGLRDVLPNLATSTDKAKIITAIELHALNQNLAALIRAVEGVGRSIR